MRPRPPLPRRAWLGLELSLGVGPAGPGPQLWVEGVDASSPAERAGIRAGDAQLELAPRTLDEVRARVARLSV